MIQFYGELSIYLLTERLLAAGQDAKCGNGGNVFRLLLKFGNALLISFHLGSSSMEIVGADQATRANA